MLGRAFAALFLEPGMGALSANTAQYLYYLGMFFLLIVGTAAFILLSNEHSYKKLKKMATYDSLTGILSRRAFLLEAEVKLTLAVRKQEYYSLYCWIWITSRKSMTPMVMIKGIRSCRILHLRLRAALEMTICSAEWAAKSLPFCSMG